MDYCSHLLVQIVDEIRHSVTILNRLSPEIQVVARHVYFDALRYAFIASTAVTAIGLISAFFARGRSLHREWYLKPSHEFVSWWDFLCLIVPEPATTRSKPDSALDIGVKKEFRHQLVSIKVVKYSELVSISHSPRASLPMEYFRGPSRYSPVP